jgi:hypothetical protein
MLCIQLAMMIVASVMMGHSNKIEDLTQVDVHILGSIAYDYSVLPFVSMLAVDNGESCPTSTVPLFNMTYRGTQEGCSY